MKRSIEPFWWSLFGAGGTLAAFFTPVLLLLNGFAVPLGLLDAPDADRMRELILHPVSRLFLFVLVSLSVFHWAHRFRFTLYDGLQLKHLNELIAVLTYGTAMLVTLVGAYVLFVS
jgi:fumarate reductase subunit D